MKHIYDEFRQLTKQQIELQSQLISLPKKISNRSHKSSILTNTNISDFPYEEKLKNEIFDNNNKSNSNDNDNKNRNEFLQSRITELESALLNTRDSGNCFKYYIIL